MPLIVVGGQTKNIGKTTLVCNIISAFPHVRWTAVKFSAHAHIPFNCELLDRAGRVSIWRQASSGDDSDTARFLKAGAARAFFIQSKRSDVQAAQIFRQEVSRETYVIAESTRMAAFLNPELFLMLMDSTATDFKKSAQELFALVDAFITKRVEGELVTKPNQIGVNRPIFESHKTELEPGLMSLIAGVLNSSP